MEDDVLFIRVGANSGINGERDGRSSGNIAVSVDELEAGLMDG